MQNIWSCFVLNSFFIFCLKTCPNTIKYRVYQLLGEAGTYYGVRFGKNIPWVTEFPFGVIKDPQYVGSILSLLACLSWVPFTYILLWVLGYIFIIHVESNEDPATRAKPLSWAGSENANLLLFKTWCHKDFGLNPQASIVQSPDFESLCYQFLGKTIRIISSLCTSCEDRLNE